MAHNNMTSIEEAVSAANTASAAGDYRSAIDIFTRAKLPVPLEWMRLLAAQEIEKSGTDIPVDIFPYEGGIRIVRYKKRPDTRTRGALRDEG